MINSNHLSLDIQNQLPPISPPCRSPIEGNLPSARYTKLTEMLRKSTNGQLQCSMFCGGRKCKYESSTNWPEKDRAISALYSHWITDHILAMARPSNEVIAQYKLVDLFISNGVKTVINLQEPGEHANCGASMDASGFAYDPKLFMDKQIYFYNFHWKDYSGVSEAPLLDMVKVVTFALSQGKIAVHCHAGLGRTGVLIAAYLIFTYRCQAHSAIKFVRMRRPNSIQSRGQILSLFKFANFISPCFIIYKSVSSKQISVTLSDFLQRQRILLHGEELRCLKYIPKVVFIICEKLIKMAGKTSTLRSKESDEEDMDNFTRHYLSNGSEIMRKVASEGNRSNSETNENDLDSIDTFDPDYNLQYEIDNFPDEMDNEREANLEMEDKLLIDSLAAPDTPQEYPQPVLPEGQYLNAQTLGKHRPSFEVLQSSLLNYTDRTAPPEVIITVMTCEPKSDANFSSAIYNYQKAINNTPTGWEKLCEEDDLETLTALLWSWFENLDSPILNNETIGLITASKDELSKSFFNLDSETRYTLEYLVRFVMRLCEQDQENKRRLVARLVAALTIKRVQLSDGESIPRQKQTWLVLSSRNREAIFHLVNALMQLIAETEPDY